MKEHLKYEDMHIELFIATTIKNGIVELSIFTEGT